MIFIRLEPSGRSLRGVALMSMWAGNFNNACIMRHCDSTTHLPRASVDRPSLVTSSIFTLLRSKQTFVTRSMLPYRHGLNLGITRHAHLHVIFENK